MHRPVRLTALFLCAAAATSSGAAFAGTYLVVDIGSSGTRPYLIEIRKEGAICYADGVEAMTKVDGGLAKDEVTDWKEKITTVALSVERYRHQKGVTMMAYATAGFRKEQNRSDEIVRILKEHGFTDVQIPIPGKDEARYAYIASKYLNDPQRAVAEMGGASAQLHLIAGDADKRAQSQQFGQDLSYQNYKSCLLQKQKKPEECRAADLEFIKGLTKTWPKVNGPAYAQGALKFMLPVGGHPATEQTLTALINAGCGRDFSSLRGCFGYVHALNFMKASGITALYNSAEGVDWPVGAAMSKEGCTP